jgi:hypothetical protein
MNHQPKPDVVPEPEPAPQLHNLPASPDDPFQPGIETPLSPPIQLPADAPTPQRPGTANPNPEVEPQFDHS